jgi:hypothetical protein
LSATVEADDPHFEFDPLLAAQDFKIKRAIAYWETKRGSRFAPARSEIELRETKEFLSHLQIFEILDGGRAFRPRLVGTAIAARVKEDATGKIFDESSPRPVVHRVLRAIRWVTEQRKPLRTFAARTALEGQDFIAHETVFLPLSSDGRTIDMMAVVGVFTPGRSQPGGGSADQGRM